MKIYLTSLIIILVLLTTSGCGGRNSGKTDETKNDTVSVPDTGYTGIKQYMSRQLLVKEVTFKNGVRQGLMKTFYPTGEVFQTFWYENGMREDSSRYYYKEGQLFRTTPYKHDTVDGIVIQYYRTGKLRAKIGYSKGLRTNYFEEYAPDGKLFTDYPDIVASINDQYSTKGLFRIELELSDKDNKVEFFRGEFTDNRFDTVACQPVNTINGKGRLDLMKTGSPGQNYVGVIASILTPLGNRLLKYKKIDLPYNDLK
jgi:hypothetical protein